MHHALLAATAALGVLLRVIHLGRPSLTFDEYNDVFAARSLLAGEGLYLPGGREYTRAWLMPLLTAGSFALFGQSEAAARLPALVFSLLTLGLLYVAGRALFGPTAGLVALGLTAVSPHAVDIARFARLYSPLTFFGLLAALAAFRALDRLGEDGHFVTRRRLGWLVLAGAAGLVACHLHPVALGLALAVQAYAFALALAWLARRRYRPAVCYGAIAVSILLVEAGAAASGAVRGAFVQLALTPRGWYQPTPGDYLVYHYHLTERYGWLWYLVWPATIVLVAARPRAGSFVALAFWVPFAVLAGVVATKHPRFVAHLLPFAWLLLGGTVEVLWPAARRALEARLGQLGLPRAARAPATAAVLVAAGAPLLRATPSVMEALRRPPQLSGTTTVGYLADWRGLAAVLAPRLEPDSAIIASKPLAIRYYFGRRAYDRDSLLVASLNRDPGDDEAPRSAKDIIDRPASYINRLLAGRRDPADGRRRVEPAGGPSAGQPPDLEALLTADYPVWVISETWRWEKDRGTRFEAQVRDACRPVPVPRALEFTVFRCRAPAAGAADVPGAGSPGTITPP